MRLPGLASRWNADGHGRRRPIPRAATLAGVAGTLLLGPAALTAQNTADEIDASGTNVLRIEKEDKLLVPLERAEEVWEFLHGWLVEDVEALRSLDPALTSTWSEEQFYDTYFDTPELTVLAREDGVRVRQRFNLTNPDDRKSGRALVQIKVSGISDDPLERAEYKYEVADPMDLSLPLLDIVRRSQRDQLRARLVGLELDPDAMRPILTIEDLRRRIYLTSGRTPFLSVSHDQVTVRKMWATIRFVEIEPELNEISYTEADSATRAYMAGIGKRISDAILERFPDVERNLTPKYAKAFGALAGRIPALRTLVRYGLHDRDGVAAIGVIGLGLIAVVGVATVRGYRGWREAREPTVRSAPDVSAEAASGR
ncbi:MAG: CYTH domain-containing protein [Gemmatimonadota bacterium]